MHLRRALIFAMTLITVGMVATSAPAIVPACPTLEYTVDFGPDNRTILSADAAEALDALMSSVRRCDGVTFALTTALSRPLDHLRANVVRNALIDRGAPTPAISEVSGTYAPSHSVTILVYSRGGRSQ